MVKRREDAVPTAHSREAPDLYRRLLEHAMSIRGGKRHDYSGAAQDWAWNFRRAAVIASALCNKEFTPRDTFAVLVGIKIARQENLAQLKIIGDCTVACEDVWDTVADAVNYFTFFEQLLYEEVFWEGERECDCETRPD